MRLYHWLKRRYSNLITRFKLRYVRDSQVEYWKDIAGTDGWYQISSHGRYRSVPRTITRRDGVKVRLKGHMMKVSLLKYKDQIKPYMRVNINLQQRAYNAHLLMQIYFGTNWRPA